MKDFNGTSPSDGYDPFDLNTPACALESLPRG